MDIELRAGMKLKVRDDFTRDDCNPGGYVPQFEPYRGKIVTVRNVLVYGRACRIKEDIDGFTWGKAIFTLPFTKKHEAIEAFIKDEISESEYKEIIKNLH